MSEIAKARKRKGAGSSEFVSEHSLKRQKKPQRHEKSGPKDTSLDFNSVNLLDSDEDLDNAVVDDGSVNSDDESDDSLDSLDHKKKPASSAKRAQPVDDDLESESSNADSGSDDASSMADSSHGAKRSGAKSKRNDPEMFATSLHKILGTKLSTTRRADPVLARSAEAREASRRVMDAALEEKARKLLRTEKRAALEKGRVKDVLVASNGSTTAGEAETTAKMLETERRLRKVAQRGVVKLFNAIRAAQIKATEAEREVKKRGILGMDNREAKVAEMSRKGFLDLIASGGGGLKKGGLEEA